MLPKINNYDLSQKIKRYSDIRVIGLIAFGVVVLLVSWSSLRVLQMNYELEKQQSDFVQKNRIEKLENENLKLKNVYYESDEYLELSARRQLNKAAPGEKLYLVPSSVALANTVNLPKSKKELQEEKAKSKPWVQRNLEGWRDFFFHLNKE